jgi:hypothetical protein
MIVMLVRERIVTVDPATSAELDAVANLMAESESVVSDAPIFVPRGAGLLLLLGLILLSPPEPAEPETR